MTKEKLIKLLKSPHKADIVLAFNLIENWDEVDLIDLFSSFCMHQTLYTPWLYKTNISYTGSRHFFLRAKCGLLLYADGADGLGLMSKNAYGGDHKEYNLYD